MRTLRALLKNIGSEIHLRRQIHSLGSRTSRQQRFLMEALETRVLLSGDADVLAALIDPPDSTSGVIVLNLDSDSVADQDEEVHIDPMTGAVEDGGDEEDFIERDTYEDIYGPFDYDTFLDLEKGGPLGGRGGTVDEDAYPTDVLTNNNAGTTGTANFTQSETSVIAFGSRKS